MRVDVRLTYSTLSRFDRWAPQPSNGEAPLLDIGWHQSPIDDYATVCSSQAACSCPAPRTPLLSTASIESFTASVFLVDRSSVVLRLTPTSALTMRPNYDCDE